MIDDNPDSRKALQDQLKGAGLDVVASGAHGLATADLLKSSNPALIFVSVEQPYPRGIQTIEYASLSQLDATVVAYSRATDVSVFQQVVRAGASYLLAAPVRPDDLHRALETITGRPAPGGTSGATGRVVVVVGQKGGIGKTAISINLAAALAANSRSSVLIIDFDTTFGDVGLALDVQGEVSAAKAASDVSKIDRETFKASLVEHSSGAFVLPAPAHVGEWLHVHPDELETLVSLGASLFDYVIVDTPGAFNDAVAAGVAVADHLLIVTSLEMTSAKNTAMLLDVLRVEGYLEDRTLVIANHTNAETGLSASDLAPQLKRESVWEVPYDATMRRASQEGHPVVITNTRGPASQSILALAERLAMEPRRIDRRGAVRGDRGTVGLRERLRLALTRAGLQAAG